MSKPKNSLDKRFVESPYEKHLKEYVGMSKKEMTRYLYEVFSGSSNERDDLTRGLFGWKNPKGCSRSLYSDRRY